MALLPEHVFVSTNTTNPKLRGDVHDWDLESSRMAGVYRSASLTLSAMDAASDTEGFLKRRPPTHTTLRIMAQSGQTEEVYLRASVGGSYFGQYEDPSQEIQPLNTRGWCLQEAYLSRRQLKFLDDRILWSCQDVEWKESTLGISVLT